MKKFSLFLIVTVVASILFSFQMQSPTAQTGSVTSGLSVRADEEPLPTPTRTYAPKLAMVAPMSNVNATAGQTLPVNVTLKNIGNSTAMAIKIYTPLMSDFTVELPNKPYEFPLGPNSTKVITINVTPDADLKAGNYPVTFTYVYENDQYTEYTGTGTIYLKVEKSAADAPNVVLSDFSINADKITAGDNFTLDFIAKNKGPKSARNIQLSIENLKTGELTTYDSANSVLVGEINGGAEQKLSFGLNASSKMKSGSYPVTVKIKYKDSSDTEYTDTFTYYVKVTTVDGATDGNRAVVEITNIANPPGVFNVAQDATIRVTIANNGDNKAKNVKITALPEAGIVPKSANIQMVNSLDIGESRTLTFVVSPTAATKTQSYSIGFMVDYQTGELDADEVPKTDQFSQYVGINVSNPKGDAEEDKIKSIPKIIISKYNLEPLIVQAGQEFDIDLEFQNTHSTKTVSNVTVSLSVIATETEKGNVFTPVDSSNIFYIERIAPKGTTDQHIRMYTVPDAKAKNYIITATFKYEDDEGNNLESTAEFGVNVKQVSKLELGDIFFPTQMNVGEQQYLSFSLQNTGKMTLYNLKVKVIGEGIDNSSSEQIFGNFASGNVEYYDASFVPTTPGPTTLSVVVSYDNDMGERIEKIETYECVINEMMMGDMQGGMEGSMPMELDKDGNPIDPNAPKGFSFASLMKNVWFWVGVGVVLAVIVVVVVLVVRKRKKQKGFDLDE